MLKTEVENAGYGRERGGPIISCAGNAKPCEITWSRADSGPTGWGGVGCTVMLVFSQGSNATRRENSFFFLPSSFNLLTVFFFCGGKPQKYVTDSTRVKPYIEAY